MKFDSAQEVEQLCYQIRLSDYPRGRNRARINSLFNGEPPWSDEEAHENQVNVNVNFLESTRLAHDARAQFYNAFLKPGVYFTARTDMGPSHRRQKYGSIVTKHINKIMKRSVPYFECFRSKFALNVLHGIGPSVWPDEYQWCPEPAGIDDMGIPARTYLHMKNLPFFYVYRSFTAPELMRLTRGERVDPGWNLDLVKRCLEWIDSETMELMGSNWPEVWSLEKLTERVKGDGGMYVGDQVPTIDAFDVYFYDDDGEESGWGRRIILDSWSTPQSAGNIQSMTRKSGDLWKANDFLYNSGTRKVAAKRESIAAFQFADLSAVGPFQYHSVRSLGFLLYATCHLQNRLRCKFSEAVFEQLLQMFRVKSEEDIQRALKLKLHGFSFIDSNLTPVPANERWQPNFNIVEGGLRMNEQLIAQHSSSYTQQPQSEDGVRKTRFQVQAEVSAMTGLVSSALNQAYAYETFEYYEIFRRFCRVNSKDPDVISFRASCLKEGVPEKILVPEAWELESERVMGGGNKAMEISIANQLMQWRPMFNPSAQQEVLSSAVLAITDDAALADRLVPDQPHISDSVHDAELAFGTLMQGAPVTPKPGLNSVEVAGTIIKLMAQKVAAIMQGNKMGTPQDLQGLGLSAQYAGAFIQMLAQDKTSKPIVKQLGDALGKLMNEVRAMGQRQQQAMQAQAQNGNGKLDPKDQAKIQATMMAAQVDAQNRRESHAQRTAERQIQFEQKIRQQQQQNEIDSNAKRMDNAQELAHNRLRSLIE